MIKISCTQENLSQGLTTVSHIANKNSNLPILSNILVKIENKILTLSSTNLEIGITTSVRGKVEEDGEFTIDARLLSDYVNLLPKERVDLDLENDDLKIECGKQKTKIKTQSASDFPLIPKIDKNNPYLISVDDFRQAVQEVAFAVSNSETRPEISGVFISFNKDNLIFAATDSYRLAEKKLKLVESASVERKIIVPVKTLQEFARILSVFKDNISLTENNNVEIYLSDNQIMLSCGGTDLVSRLVEGQYPDYTQIIPNDFKTRLNINRNELIKVVKTASLFTKTGIQDIKIEFTGEGNNLTINASSSQYGENTSLVEAVINGEKNHITLNYRYLLDGLQNISDENIILEINDSNTPCLLKPEKTENYLYIIMPIRQ